MTKTPLPVLLRDFNDLKLHLISILGLHFF